MSVRLVVPETPTSPVTIKKMTAAPEKDVESDTLAVDISLSTEGADPLAYRFSLRGATADIKAPNGSLTNETESAWFTETFSTRTTLSMRLGFRYESDSTREDSDERLDDGTIMSRLGVGYALGAERVRVHHQLNLDNGPYGPGPADFLQIFFREDKYAGQADGSPVADLRQGASHSFANYAGMFRHFERNETGAARAEPDWIVPGAGRSGEQKPGVTAPASQVLVTKGIEILGGGHDPIVVYGDSSPWYRDLKVVVGAAAAAVAAVGGLILINGGGDEQVTLDDPATEVEAIPNDDNAGNDSTGLEADSVADNEGAGDDPTEDETVQAEDSEFVVIEGSAGADDFTIEAELSEPISTVLSIP